MREVLDRLREAETALDDELRELYYASKDPLTERAIHLLWQARLNIWYAQMHALNAAAATEPDDST